jgi:hypothetical protein
MLGHVYPHFFRNLPLNLDNCLHKLTNNCQRAWSLTGSVHVGWRCVYVNPNSWSTTVREGIRSCWKKGVLAPASQPFTSKGFFLARTVHQYVYFYSRFFALRGCQGFSTPSDGDIVQLTIIQSITWLILARALAGVGGGGIVSSVWTITSEIVSVNKRAHWSQALSVE